MIIEIDMTFYRKANSIPQAGGNRFVLVGHESSGLRPGNHSILVAAILV